MSGNQKRVLAVVGSPRKGGNTDILVDEILAGASEAGAAVEKVRLTDLEIAPCKACSACRATGECVQKDDMREMFEKMKASDIWVLGTPVYWWGPSAQLKAFVDRWYGKADETGTKEIFNGRRVILAVPLGDTDPKTARHVVGMFEDSLDYVGAQLFASILAPGAYDMGDVRKEKHVLEKARQTGRDAVRK
jgi:multimeric flavodoxin WrbA